MSMLDVVIIGGGVVGACIARELSKYQLETVLLEKNPEVGAETSRVNSGIVHGGYDAKEGSLKAKLNVRGNQLIRELAPVLHLHFKQCGSLVVAFSDDDMQAVHNLYERGIKNGVPGMEIWDTQTLRAKEPNISPEAVGALFCGTAGIICPFNMTCAFMENAIENGVRLQTDSKVLDIQKESDGFRIKTKDQTYKSKYIVNAAGLYSDKIAALVGDHDYTICPRKGEYRILDKSYKDLVNYVIFQAPTKMGKGILVTPTYHENIMVGPTATDVESVEDVSVDTNGLRQLDTLSKKSVPRLDLRKTIRVFSGVRARPNTGEFMIYPSKNAKGFIHAGGIESPGLTSAPAIAEYVAELLNQEGCVLQPKQSFKAEREAIPQFALLPPEEQAKLIKENPLYGHVICRCETITEAEIVQAIHKPAGARTLDGVKRRVRPGAGRCQGGFCAPRVMEILSRELHIPMEKILKDHQGSEIVIGKLKEAAK